MRKVNYRSDFDAFLRLTDAAGNEVGWPDYDWTALFYTSNKEKGYRASCIDGECVNCFNDEGRIHVVFDNQNMGLGELKVDFKMSIPEEIYPDGLQNIVSPQRLDIMLTDSPGDGDISATLDIRLPYVETACPDDRVSALEERVENSESRISQLEERYVGVWDELDSIKEAIAIIQNVATDGLLRRLGYNDEDIKWFKFAIMHFDLGISQNDLEESVKEWETHKNIDPGYHQLICTVMPKYIRNNKWNSDTPERFGSKFDLEFVRFFPTVELTDVSENQYASLGNGFNIYSGYTGTFMAGAIGLSYETEWFYIPQQTLGIGTLDNVWPETTDSKSGKPLRYIGSLKNCYRMSENAFTHCSNLKDLTGVDISSSLNADEGSGNDSIFYVPDRPATKIGSWDLDPKSNQFQNFCCNRILYGGELHFSARTPIIGGIYANNLKIYGYDNRDGNYGSDIIGEYNRFFELGGISELYPDKLYVDYRGYTAYLTNIMFHPDGSNKWKLFWPDKSNLPVTSLSVGFAEEKAPDVYIYGFHHITQVDGAYQALPCFINLTNLIRNFNPETDAAMLKESLASWLSIEKPSPEISDDDIKVTVKMTQAMFDVLDETEDVAPLVSKGYTITIV